MEKSTKATLDKLARITEEVISRDELVRILDSGKQLRIKYGVDVTAPLLHIGHAVNLWAMRHLQDEGHKVIFLIGDFTTQIGDPTGRSKTRPTISLGEIERNAQEFIAQAKMVLRDDPDLLEIRSNSEWYDKMGAGRLLTLCSMVTHSRLISRDMFQKRIENSDDIYIHELLYPVLQGYDSFELSSDLTIIGNDQLFNEMLGRFFQEKMGQPPQVIITTKITPGIDGKAKQSKSLGNYIGLGHSPREKFGRVMSIPDELIPAYFEVYTELPLKEVDQLRKDLPDRAMAIKKLLARTLVARYHGDHAAQAEQRWFEDTFSNRIAPADMPELRMSSDSIKIVDLVKMVLGETTTNSAAKRLISSGSVTIDGEKVSDYSQTIQLKGGEVLKVGKRTWRKILL